MAVNTTGVCNVALNCDRSSNGKFVIEI